MFEWILIANIFTTLFMTGVIWFVQVVQYPGFRKVSSSDFRDFHQFHVFRIGLIVIAPMIVELVTSIWLVVGFIQFWMLNTVGLGLVICIWISTFAIQLPIHQTLQQGALKNIPILITTNWIRTILWSAKAILSFYLLFILT